MIKYNNNTIQKFSHLKYYSRNNIDDKSLLFLNNLNASEDLALEYFIDRFNFFLYLTSTKLDFKILKNKSRSTQIFNEFYSFMFSDNNLFNYSKNNQGRYNKIFISIENYCIDILHCFYKNNISKSNKEIKSLYHICFPPREPIKRRSPISLNNIELMYANISKSCNSSFVQKKNRVIIKLLEMTGARVGEIALLTVKNIENIFNEDKPVLKTRTLKRRGGLIEYRYIPVNKAHFNEISIYIKIYRNKIIRNTVGKTNDDGFLLINQNTGNKILPVTITNEINKIRTAAGIEEKVCTHMSRH